VSHLKGREMISRSSLRGSAADELRLSGRDDYVDKLDDVIRIFNWFLYLKYASEIPPGIESSVKPLNVSLPSGPLLYVPWTERSLFG
jgi:hypothetical protein